MEKLKPFFVSTLFMLFAAPVCCFAQTGSWSSVGGNSPLKSQFPVLTLATDTTGNIFAAGVFQNNSAVSYVAKWDKATNNWSELGGTNSMSKRNNWIFSITTDVAGNVYVGNSLSDKNDNTYYTYVAKWDKNTDTWGELGGTNSLSVNNWIYSVAADATGNIYAGGFFTNASKWHYIAKWDKTANAWSELGGDNSLKANDEIRTVTTDALGNVYAAGTFKNANGNRYVAMWNKATNSWSELGGDNSLKANEMINAITTDALGNVYAGGFFTNSKGEYYVAKWNKTTNTWNELAGNNYLQANGFITSLISVKENVYASGSFTNKRENWYVAEWSDTANNWSELGGDNSLRADKGVWALTSDTKENIYAGGAFYNNIGNIYVAEYSRLVSITTVNPLAACADSNITIIGTNFQDATEVTVGGKAVKSFKVISSTVIEAVIDTNASGDIFVYTPLGAAIYSGFTTSNPVTPSISISANSLNICAGTLVNFTSDTSYGGTDPSWQWQVNGKNIGKDSIGFVYNSFNDGDSIRCILTSNYSCVTSDTAVSNTIIINVNPLVSPSVTIKASANNICKDTMVTFTAAAFNAGTSPTYQWKKNGLNVGTNTSIYTDSLIADNDTISCELTSNKSCLTSSTAESNEIVMKLIGNAQVYLGADTTICSDAGILLNVHSGYSSYVWQDGSTDSFFNAKNEGIYFVQVQDGCGSVYFDTIMISLQPSITGFLKQDTAICSYSSIELEPAGIFSKYFWSNNATTRSITVISPGIYWLAVTDDKGCISKDSIQVNAKNCKEGIYIPTAFTPNSDGKNDIFKPTVYGNLSRYEFIIYNRWGEVVFKTNNTGAGWNGILKGKIQNQDSFIWVCTYQFEGDNIAMQKGTVTLVR